MNKRETESKSSTVKSKQDKKNEGSFRQKKGNNQKIQIIISSQSEKEQKIDQIDCRQVNNNQPSQVFYQSTQFQGIAQPIKDSGINKRQGQIKAPEKKGYVTKSIQQEVKPEIVVNLNKFNLKNLQKASVPLVDFIYPNEPLQKDYEPTIVQNDQPELQIQKTSALRNLFTYQRQGSQSVYYTSMLNIRQKITDSIRPKKMVQAIQLDEREEQNQSVIPCNKKDSKDVQQKSRNKMPRYFQEKKLPGDLGYDSEQGDKVIKCFRCKQQGHIARNCPQQALKQKCTYCQEEHHYSECDKNRCFKCGEKDHVAEKCQKKGVRCHKCNKIGHKEQSCGFIVFLDYHSKQLSEINSKYDKQDMRRLKCLLGVQCRQGARGHFNCFAYTKNKPMPYQKKPRDQLPQKGQSYNYKKNQRDLNQQNKQNSKQHRYDRFDRRQHSFARRYEQNDFDQQYQRNNSKNKFHQSKNKHNGRQRSYRK